MGHGRACHGGERNIATVVESAGKLSHGVHLLLDFGSRWGTSTFSWILRSLASPSSLRRVCLEIGGEQAARFGDHGVVARRGALERDVEESTPTSNTSWTTNCGVSARMRFRSMRKCQSRSAHDSSNACASSRGVELRPANHSWTKPGCSRK